MDPIDALRKALNDSARKSFDIRSVMGYTTEFAGQFNLNRKLEQHHLLYLHQFAETRRMSRSPEVAETFPDDLRTAVGLPIGLEGGYFVGATGFAGQDRDDSVMGYNTPPKGQPGLWCQWVPTIDGTGLEWNGAEKFYDYVPWLLYLIDHFLKPWGYVLNGTVTYSGEDRDDRGVIIIEDNEVEVVYE